ncbi:MAG: hypothetical protein ACLP7A_01500 [Desulfobaccales bacterium]
MDIDYLTLSKLVKELQLAAENCPKCAGTRETVFTSRGRDNIVNCLECEPVHHLLATLEAALEYLKQGQ